MTFFLYRFTARLSRFTELRLRRKGRRVKYYSFCRLCAPLGGMQATAKGNSSSFLKVILLKGKEGDVLKFFS